MVAFVFRAFSLKRLSLGQHCHRQNAEDHHYQHIGHVSMMRLMRSCQLPDHSIILGVERRSTRAALLIHEFTRTVIPLLRYGADIVSGC